MRSMLNKCVCVCVYDFYIGQNGNTAWTETNERTDNYELSDRAAKLVYN